MLIVAIHNLPCVEGSQTDSVIRKLVCEAAATLQCMDPEHATGARAELNTVVSVVSRLPHGAADGGAIGIVAEAHNSSLVSAWLQERTTRCFDRLARDVSKLFGDGRHVVAVLKCCAMAGIGTYTTTGDKDRRAPR